MKTIELPKLLSYNDPTTFRKLRLWTAGAHGGGNKEEKGACHYWSYALLRWA